MNNLVEFLVWTLVIFGFANGISVSKLFEPFRKYLRFSKYEILEGGEVSYSLRKNKLVKILADLVHCPMCLGFWVGAFVGVFLYSPSSNIFLVQYNFWCFLADAFLGSATSWLWYLAISNRQYGK